MTTPYSPAPHPWTPDANATPLYTLEPVLPDPNTASDTPVDLSTLTIIPPPTINYTRAHALGFNTALIDNIASMRKGFTHEYCIVDNSHSTTEIKGLAIDRTGKNPHLVKSTVWDQIKETVARRAKVIAALGADDEVGFTLLNPLDRQTTDELVDRNLLSQEARGSTIKARHIQQALACITPWGNTPLVPAINRLSQDLRASQIHNGGVNAHITFFTDGTPTDDDGYDMSLDAVANAVIHLFVGIRATIVIHLATNDERIKAFYNELDVLTGENISIEVMLDLKNEQDLINDVGNGWFKQSEAAEVARAYLAGKDNFDKLNEEPLGLVSITDIVITCYGRGDNALPNAERHFSAFKRACQALIANQHQSLGVVNSARRTLKNIHMIEPKHFPRSSKYGCSLM